MNFKNLIFPILILLFFSCEGPSPNSDWKERDDFIGPNGETMTGEDAEKAGLVIYNILKWILTKESVDTLEVVSKPFPWEEYNEADQNLSLLEEIKNGYTFENKISVFDKKKTYPTFYYNIGIFPKEKKMHYANIHWKLKNHEYAFKDEAGKDVEVEFFIEPKSIPIKNRTSFTINSKSDEKGVPTIEYYAKLEYKPKIKEEVISSGSASFDIYLKEGYTKMSINAKLKGKTINYKGRSLKVKDFTKDFAVFEKMDDSTEGFRIISLAKDGKQYRIKRKKGILQLFNGKAGKINVSKIVWDYVESINYKLDKDAFLEWFAAEILTNNGQYTKKEKEESYSVVYSVGAMDTLIIYGEDWVDKMHFEMEL
jgi:hypothetical protein